MQPFSQILRPGETNPRAIVNAVNAAIQGKTNNVDEVTLAAGAPTTTFNNNLLAPGSVVLLIPATANAAAALATTYIGSYSGGSCIISHANNAQTDRTFKLVIVG